MSEEADEAEEETRSMGAMAVVSGTGEVGDGSRVEGMVVGGTGPAVSVPRPAMGWISSFSHTDDGPLSNCQSHEGQLLD